MTQPYDVDFAVAELRAYRECDTSPLVQEQVRIGDNLAAGIRSNFSESELALVGRVMVLVGASIQALGLTPAYVVGGVVGFGGQQLVDGGGR